MKKKLLPKTLLLFIFFASMLNANSAFAIARTWVGVGSGGVGTDFNNVANWTGGGALSALDDFTMTLTTNTTQTISLSASITVNTLTVTQNSGSGQRTTTLNVAGFVLTVNGNATFNAVRFSSPISYDVLRININTGGNIIFNGVTRIHTNGNGDTYLITENGAGAGVAPGTVTFNNNLYVGTWGLTSPPYEPNMVFNAVGAQTFVSREAGGGYQFKGQNITFGTTNTPTVTIRGPGAAYFNSYDGNITVAANTSIIIPDTTVVGFMCVLDRFNTGAGTFSMGAGATITTGCPNRRPMTGFLTYTLNATSTVNYNSSGWQDMMPITYGHVINDGGTGTPWKYSNGAQTMQGNFTVQTSAIYGPWLAGGLTINGNTLIQTSGVFNATRDNTRPNTTHTLRGNFTNNATFTSGTPVGINTILFNSTIAGQTIGGTALTTFYHLTINNTSGSGVTLGRSENVSESAGTGVLTLTAGPLFLNTFTLAVQNPATTAIVRTAGHVVSEMNAATNTSILQWNIGATNGTYIVPFGVAGTYIPFTFAKTAGNSNMQFSTRATVADDNLPWSSSVTSMITYITVYADGSIPSVIDRWWDITALAGSTSVTADLTFSYRGSENSTTLAPTSNFGAQHWNGTSWDAPIGSSVGVTAGVGTVSITGANSFSPWVLSSSSAPLPIELVSFTAFLNDNKVDLTWQTASETNNDFFTIEKSKDGQSYEPVGTVDGAGNSSASIEYFATDHNPYIGISYYRLKQTDFDGRYSYSNLVPLEYNPNGVPSISLFPNPSNSGTTMYIYLNQMEGEEVLLHLRDISGRELFSKIVTTTSNNELVVIGQQGEIAKGSYLFTVTSKNNIYNKKLIVK